MSSETVMRGSNFLININLTSPDTEMILLKHSYSSISDPPWGVPYKLVFVDIVFITSRTLMFEGLSDCFCIAG